MKKILLLGMAIMLMGAKCEKNDEKVCDPGETQSCVCPSGDLGSQACSYSGERWKGCQCGESYYEEDAGTAPSQPQNCKPAGYAILSCGCWGPAYEGQIRTATGCCSNQAYSTAVGCWGDCAGGTIPWGNVCL